MKTTAAERAELRRWAGRDDRAGCLIKGTCDDVDELQAALREHAPHSHDCAVVRDKACNCYLRDYLGEDQC